MLYHFGTGTRSSKAWRLKKYYPQAFMEINISDARRLNISNNDKVKVVSPTGEVTTTARITDTLPEGTLFIPISFPETPVNKLFGIILDPQSKTPSIKSCSVRIERIDLHGSNE
jgi:predicted molibdopterin-dependent oxidoreductase YjgC